MNKMTTKREKLFFHRFAERGSAQLISELQERDQHSAAGPHPVRPVLPQVTQSDFTGT